MHFILSECYLKAWDDGDWEKLTELIDVHISDTDEGLELAPFSADASAKYKSAQAFQFLYKTLGASDKKTIVVFLIALCQARLGRVALVLDRKVDALNYFHSAYKECGDSVKPFFYSFLYSEAEAKLYNGEAKSAIQVWQDLASILQEKTPEEVYHRMSHCYAVNQQGFGGLPDENKTWGDCHKHVVFDFFHSYLQPSFYLEIGVDEGLSLIKAKCKALGIDARPKLKLAVELPATTKILGFSSDAFFRDHAEHYLDEAPDLAFIDGMHLFEFALRDFINLERYAAPHALIGIDDIFPCHPVQALRRRQSTAWAGDVWKLLPVLKKYRPDLTIITLGCSSTGLMLISGLDKNNTELLDYYDQIMEEYQKDLLVPEYILKRADSLPSDHPFVTLLLSTLKHAKETGRGRKAVQEGLESILPVLQQALNHDSGPLRPATLKDRKQQDQLDKLNNFVVQLFIPQPFAPFYSESASYKQYVPADGWRTVEFDFEATELAQPLRFDPSLGSGVFEIRDITLSDKNKAECLLSLEGQSLLQSLRVGGDAFRLKADDGFFIYSYAADPQLYLPFVSFGGTRYALSITIRRVENVNELRHAWHEHSRD